ncbi:tetratricopeptide repeat protein [Streptomyces sp. NPDC005181]|uniref:tetratricopeptide repeat protein n=1 Tax=Streptomyces sp. NPDC005181 TaxID=3156869 RepID=UPI0033B57A41
MATTAGRWFEPAYGRPERPDADLATRNGTTVQIAWSHHYTAIALRKLGRSDEAVASASQATGLFKSLGDIDSYYASISNLGHCLRDEGRYDEALERYREAFALVSDDESGMTPSIAAHLRPYTLADLGRCLGLLGHRGEAITTLTAATAVMESFDSNIMQALALETLAALLAEEGQTGGSRRAYARAAEVYEVIGDAEAHSRCHDLATGAP